VTAPKATRLYGVGNLQAARIIAADPGKYQGILQTWARLIIERAQPTIKGPLFAQRRAA
jgi:hypothetical protein